ncbi:MMPL family transporter [Streptomyces sp. ACA25]|uniref:MMPL family transporter n=1 Tax=Streptomyces sp. ACA25 TaxID=3022596 RepID=UPI002306FB3E|nr:MMPL family transporter [Streptomyces sp. ACA25]MDB1086688.1 MMPL family transporter [Streptomyces sp. ACA25]
MRGPRTPIPRPPGEPGIPDAEHPSGIRRFTSRLSAAGGRRGKSLVLGLWLLLAMSLGPLAGKLGEVEDTSANAFLPRSAESTEYNTALERFRSDDALMPAVIVYTAAEGGELSPEGERKAAADHAAARQHTAPGEELPPPLPSEDGEALMVVVPVAHDDQLFDTVDEIRALVAAGLPPGTEAHVGGPSPSLQDNVAVFQDLDTKLLAGSALVVTVLLLLIYRSPLLWLLPLTAVAFAAVLTQAATYLLAEYANLPVDPQSAGILMVLVFGVGTDYALLLIARYREELHRHEDRHAAMRLALSRCLPAVLASAGTIALGLSCLALADVNSSRSLGLVGAVGAICTLFALVTLLPALLVATGRWVFWPVVPRYGTPYRSRTTLWQRIGRVISRRPRWSWLMAVGLTGSLALGVTGITLGLTHADLFRTAPESVTAQERISDHYPAGASDPAGVITAADTGPRVAAAAEEVPGVAAVTTDARSADNASVLLTVVLEDEPDSEAAKRTVERLRDAVHSVDGADAAVGGATAELLDTQRASERDLKVVIPAVLAVVLAVLIVLLRSLTAPALLLGAAVLSNVAALGAAYLLFTHVFGFAGVDWSVPLMGFVFLTALGIDYTIFLMTRVREEVRIQGHERGVIAGLTSTGGVITSAGIVLAATFAVIATLPLVPMAQLGIVVSIGILIDTILIRSVLVPGAVLDLGRRSWWPGELSRTGPLPPPGAQGEDRDGTGRPPAPERKQERAGTTET